MKSWLDLESRFRNLGPALQFSRLDAQWGAAGVHWRVAGSTNTLPRQEFELLCGVGGQLLEKVFSPKKENEQASLLITDPRIRWFEMLKLHSPAFGDRGHGQQINDDGSSAGFIFTGSLSNIANASANLCLALQISHPIVERPSRWQWLHDNYIKALVVGGILAVASAAAKFLIG